MVNGDQVNVKSDGFINAIIVNAAPISRTFYSGQYDPETPLRLHVGRQTQTRLTVRFLPNSAKLNAAWTVNRTSKVLGKVRAVHVVTNSVLRYCWGVTWGTVPTTTTRYICVW